MLDYLENDEAVNDNSRQIIADMLTEHGQCWLGIVNIHAHDKGRPVLRQYFDGDMVHNFEVSFVLPVHDDELERMILKRDATPYTTTAADAVLVDAIYDRIYALGGRALIWS